MNVLMTFLIDLIEISAFELCRGEWGRLSFEETISYLERSCWTAELLSSESELSLLMERGLPNRLKMDSRLVTTCSADSFGSGKHHRNPLNTSTTARRDFFPM